MFEFKKGKVDCLAAEFDIEGKDVFSVERSVEHSKEVTIIGYVDAAGEENEWFLRCTEVKHNEFVERLQKKLKKPRSRAAAYREILLEAEAKRPGMRTLVDLNKRVAELSNQVRTKDKEIADLEFEVRRLKGLSTSLSDELGHRDRQEIRG